MKTQANQTLYNLIRAYMHSLGTSRTTVVALKSYMEAVRRLKCSDADFRFMLDRLNAVIKKTEPKVIPLVHLIEAFEAEMAASGNLSLDDAKKRAVESLLQKLESFQTATAEVTRQCMHCIAPGDLIIAHSATAHIREALVRAHKELKQDFKVLVLKQDFIRTRELIDDLRRHQVYHVLIPEYNLSHYLGSASKLFIGAVSVTADNQAVTGVGTANVVSLCHWYHVPVYLFVESIKFAHRALAEQRIHNEEQHKTEADFTFHMKTFSHDFVDLKMIDHLVTDTGER
ncbi:hypothetical protein [Desulfosarcina sp.]|uniref:hypothetical protein n=1 Tax=Desulfosarcina sp. TaxID=2027861 RepID=UPI003565C3CE